MQEPCSSCDERASCFGGCRCQAYLLTGDPRATDPACDKSPSHGLIRQAVQQGENRPGDVVPVMRNKRNAREWGQGGLRVPLPVA